MKFKVFLWLLARVWSAILVRATTNNYTLGKPVTVSSTYTTNYGSNAVDSVVADASRWLGAPSGAGNWLEIELGAAVTLRQAHVYLGCQTQAGWWIRLGPGYARLTRASVRPKL